MEYPHEILIQLEADENFVGRITLNKLSATFNVEVDIINIESRKIFRHVGMLYKIYEHDEAVEVGVQLLSDFLNKLDR